MNLFAEALDVLLFRKSHPFTAGESGRAASVFPPSVIPFQGAVRTALASELGVPFDCLCSVTGFHDPKVAYARSLIGDPNTPDDLGRLRIRGPHPARVVDGKRLEVLFPAPRNTLWVNSLAGSHFRVLVPQDEHGPHGIVVGGGRPGSPGGCRLLCDARATQPGTPSEGLWLTARALHALLNGQEVPASDIIHEEDLFVIESRSGIERDGTARTAAAGKLYQVDFVRMRPGIGFFLSVELAEDAGQELTGLLPNEGFLPLGGERRAVHFRVAESSEIADYGVLTAPMGFADPMFVVYLATPAVFRPSHPGAAGWLPEWVDERTLEASGGLAPGLRIVAAALGKPTPLGGWDLAKKQPKPLRWAVPAGSVYYCEMKGACAGSGRALHAQAISEFLPEAGMGQVFVGRWPDVE